MSQDIFQRKNDKTYENCKGAVRIADDVQVFDNEKTHDINLHEAMECTRKADIKLNFEKCILKTKCGSFFGKCDAASSLMTTFYTPFGRYKFLIMPFGLQMSQDIFQRKIEKTYENYKGAVGIAVDAQVFGNEKTQYKVM